MTMVRGRGSRVGGRPGIFTGYGIVCGHVLCKKQAVFGGASCSCHWVCEAPWTSGGPTSGRRRRGRYHSLPRFYRGGAVGSRRDRKNGPEKLCDCRRLNERC